MVRGGGGGFHYGGGSGLGGGHGGGWHTGHGVGYGHGHGGGWHAGPSRPSYGYGYGHGGHHHRAHYPRPSPGWTYGYSSYPLAPLNNSYWDYNIYNWYGRPYQPVIYEPVVPATQAVNCVAPTPNGVGTCQAPNTCITTGSGIIDPKDTSRVLFPGVCAPNVAFR